MRQFHLRTYTLDSKESLDQYTSVVYPRHLVSFPKYGIEPHGFFRPVDETEATLYVLVSYAEGADEAAVEAAFLASPEIRQDLEGFDPTHMVGVTDVTLVATPGSPLN